MIRFRIAKAVLGMLHALLRKIVNTQLAQIDKCEARYPLNVLDEQDREHQHAHDFRRLELGEQLSDLDIKYNNIVEYLKERISAKS